MVVYNSTRKLTKDKNIYENVYKGTIKPGFSALFGLFHHWNGSVFRLIWHHMLIWLTAYLTLELIYLFVLCTLEDKDWKHTYEQFCKYCLRFSKNLPVELILGFYVTSVVGRWWDQFSLLPFSDELAMKVVNFLPNTDDKTFNLRRTVVRYINLSTILVFRLVSEKVRKRFPDCRSLIEAKLMLPEEVEQLKNIDEKNPHESTMIPILWAMKIVTNHAVHEKNESTSKLLLVGYLNQLQVGFDNYVTSHRKILNYAWANFPLAYTQVVHKTVYVYFLAALFSRQCLRFDNPEDDPNYDFFVPFYIPFFTLVQFFCYMGWTKVAETLLNPFGDDDEDFQVNYLIDRNLQVSYLIVDQAESENDQFLDPFPMNEIPDLSQSYENVDLRKSMEQSGNGQENGVENIQMVP